MRHGDDQLPSSVRTMVRSAALVAVVVAAVVLLGWVLNVPALKSVLPGMVTMKVNTALCFACTGAAFWIIGGTVPSSLRPRRSARLIAVICSALVLVVCGLTLLEYFSGWNLGLDEAFFKDAASAHTSHPGIARGDSRPACAVIGLINEDNVENRARCLQMGADYFLNKSREFERVPAVLKKL